MQKFRSFAIWLLVIGFIGVVYSQADEESYESLEETKIDETFVDSNDEKSDYHDEETVNRIKRHQPKDAKTPDKGARMMVAADNLRAQREREEQRQRERQRQMELDRRNREEALRQRLRDRAGGRDGW